MSKREKLFLFLCSGTRTSLEIQKEVNTVAVGSMAADLRKKGCDVWCKYIGKSDTGAEIFSYTMASFPPGLYGIGA
jgi:archaeosine-15-forming tRNA-guanine transglycosylase